MSNGCIEYQCVDSGLEAIWKCGSVSDTSVCINGECVEKKSKDKKTNVVITINTTDIASITADEVAEELSEISHIPIDDMTIAIEYSDIGVIKSITIYGVTKEQANTVRDAVNEIVNKGNCTGILCNSTEAEVIVKLK